MDGAIVPASTSITEGAGFGIRVVARIIDSVYGQVLGFAGGLTAGVALLVLEQAGLVAPGWQERMEGASVATWTLGFVAALTYHSLMEGMCGASVGKLICQLRVVAEDGQAITMTKAFKRSLLYFWDALFFGLIGYNSMKKTLLSQRYGDHWAHTVVVKSRAVPADARSGIEIFVLAFLMATVAFVACLAVGLIIAAR